MSLATKSFILFIIVKEFPNIVAMQDCHVTWHEFNDNCYKLFQLNEYFNTAEELCKSQGAHLTSISGNDENQFVNQLVQNETKYLEAWIGFKIENNGGKSWTDATNVIYTNFRFQKPNFNSKRCTIIIPGGKWADITCFYSRPYVCKKDTIKPQEKDNTALILTIAIPLGCVFIMILFVFILCLHSHKELKQLQNEIPVTNVANSGGVIQNANTTSIRFPFESTNNKRKTVLIDQMNRVQRNLDTIDDFKMEQEKHSTTKEIHENDNNRNSLRSTAIDGCKTERSIQNGLSKTQNIELLPMKKHCDNAQVTTKQISISNLSNSSENKEKEITIQKNNKKLTQTTSQNSFFRKIPSQRPMKRTISDNNNNDDNVVENKFAIRYLKSQPNFKTIYSSPEMKKGAVTKENLKKLYAFRESGQSQKHNRKNEDVQNGKIDVFKIHNPENQKPIDPPTYFNKMLNDTPTLVTMQNSKQLVVAQQNHSQGYTFKEILRSESIKHKANLFPKNKQASDRIFEVTKL